MGCITTFTSFLICLRCRWKITQILIYQCRRLYSHCSFPVFEWYRIPTTDLNVSINSKIRILLWGLSKCFRKPGTFQLSIVPSQGCNLRKQLTHEWSDHEPGYMLFLIFPLLSNLLTAQLLIVCKWDLVIIVRWWYRCGRNIMLWSEVTP